MKILFTSKRPAYPFFLGGAERSFFELGKALAEAGHKVVMLGQCSRPLENVERFFAAADLQRHTWQHETVKIFDREVPRLHRLTLELEGWLRIVHTFLPDYRRLLAEVKDSFLPDVICTQLEGSLDVVELGSNDGIPVLHFVRDTFNSNNFYPLTELPFPQLKPTCIANSAFTADFLDRTLGVASEVLYPIVLPMESTPKSTRGRRILFVNPEPVKGGELMLEVARRLRDFEFLILPGWGRQVPDAWRQLPHVEVWQWPVMQMADAYRSADLAVVPSQGTEGFGRVPVEAQVCGLPVMASQHSGLAEVLGDSAWLIADYSSPSEWCRAIRRAFEDDERLEELAALGKRNATRFVPAAIAQRFETIVAAVGARVKAGISAGGVP